MPKERKAKNFLPKPIYPGGPKAMNTFIANELKYPEEARQNRIEGTVVIRLDINYKGTVTAAHVKSSLGYGCDEEAQRVGMLLNFTVNGQYRRGKLLFHKNLNIHFRLPKPKVQATKIQYQITKETKESSSASYNYTITLPD